MVGAATACLLLRAGFSVALIEAREPPAFDESDPVGLRVSAISPGSQSVLEHAGAWRIIEGRRHCPYRRMHVEETGDGKLVALDFASAEFGLERLGSIVENDSIASALWQVLEARQTAGDSLGIHRPASLVSMEFKAGGVEIALADGECFTVAMVVGADGPRSGVREFAGIDQKIWHYGQKGIVAVVRAAKPNPGVAWQRFMEGGPLAFLPLDDGSSSIVWTRPNLEAQRLLELEAAAFSEELQAASNEWLGPIEACGPRAAFDLTMRLSERYSGNRSVLVGDAAHVVHPLAGQGVNLGFLDAAALVELLTEARVSGTDWKEQSALQATLERYARWRRSDAEVMARGIHGIRALFTPPLLAPLRRLGMRLVGNSWHARQAFVRRAAGVHSDAPAVARGLS